MTIRYSLPWLFLGSVTLFAGTHACGAGDVSSPRNQGGNSSSGFGGSFGNGNGGSNSNTGGFGTGNGGSNNPGTGTGGGFGAGQGGSNNPGTGTGGGFGAGQGGSNTGTGGGFGAGQGGSSSAGTGGSSVIGAGGSTGTGGAPVGTDAAFVMNGYGMTTSPAWHGYLYTGTYGTNATIMPPMFGMATGASACVSGNVNMDPAYASGSFLGWNLNQATTGGAGSEMPAVTSGAGVQLTIAGTVAGFRVELIDATAVSYCYVIPAGGTSPLPIPWASFKTNCTDSSKTQAPFAGGMSINKMQITIGSTPSMVFPFNFCLINVASM